MTQQYYQTSQVHTHGQYKDSGSCQTISSPNMWPNPREVPQHIIRAAQHAYRHRQQVNPLPQLAYHQIVTWLEIYSAHYNKGHTATQCSDEANEALAINSQELQRLEDETRRRVHDNIQVRRSHAL